MKGLLLRIIKSLCFLWLSALAGDLLYLYYTGGWCDPNKAIETAEIFIKTPEKTLLFKARDESGY